MNYFPIKILTQQLIQSKVYLGTRIRNWNPRYGSYLLGHRYGFAIIDVSKTSFLLKRALYFVRRAAFEGGRILFIGSRLKAEYNPAGHCWSRRWTPGMLTNFQYFRNSILAKKVGFRYIPDIVVLLYVDKYNKLAVNECRLLKIPLVAVINSHVDPTYFMYPIPGRTSRSTTRTYAGLFAETLYQVSNLQKLGFKIDSNNQEKLEKEEGEANEDEEDEENEDEDDEEEDDEENDIEKKKLIEDKEEEEDDDEDDEDYDDDDDDDVELR